MAVQMGLEPTISSVTGRHVNHYTTGPTLFMFNGADEGNRTPVSTLARLCSTIKLHLQKWRSRRDLNSRASFPTYTLSRGTSSASWVLLHKDCLNIIAQTIFFGKQKFYIFLIKLE